MKTGDLVIPKCLSGKIDDMDIYEVSIAPDADGCMEVKWKGSRSWEPGYLADAKDFITYPD